MNSAQRQADSRARRKREQDDAERRKLIAQLMKVYRRLQSAIVIDAKEKPRDWEEAHKTAGQHRRPYLEQLNQMSLDQLKSVLTAENDTPDSHGRLHNERSGEAGRSHGQSEIEQILAAKQYDSSYFDVDDEDAGQDPQLAGGFRTKLEGAGPETFDAEDPTADVADNVRGGPVKPIYEATTSEKWLSKAIAILVNKLDFESVDFESMTGPKCPFCDVTFLVKDSATRHLEEQYSTGPRNWKARFNRSWAFQQLWLKGSMPSYIEVDNPPELPHAHLLGISDEVAEVKSNARKLRFRDIG
jgi:hypothetical protein